jgi:hypothetical protein
VGGGVAGRLAAWAAAWPERTWAAGGARGLGSLLDWQLVAAGERVPGVQPKLGARARLLGLGIRTRMTLTTPGRSPSRRCARAPGGR